MSKLLQKLSRSILSEGKYFVTRTTKKEKVLRLLQKLHPVKSAHPLIRIGSTGDGGYLVPNYLEGIEACFSPGVDVISEFELEIANRGSKVFMADATVSGPAASHENFYFVKKHLSAIASEQTISLESWIEGSDFRNNNNKLLQMDIEGAEYEVLLDTSLETLSSFRFMIIEFHDLDQLLNRFAFSLMSPAFEKILETHNCVHIHPNNCAPATKRYGVEIPPVMEFTFERKSESDPKAYVCDFPHELDADNTNKAPITLPDCWFRQST